VAPQPQPVGCAEQCRAELCEFVVQCSNTTDRDGRTPSTIWAPSDRPARSVVAGAPSWVPTLVFLHSRRHKYIQLGRLPTADSGSMKHS
jgi:hypothetical protein